ncbi:MAG TPA: tetratricopeptide repeat protein, partial [Chromatiaceae bacterium]|nr:tetratricopeptide repeat protein [Chromatiaceae bacterium]
MDKTARLHLGKNLIFKHQIRAFKLIETIVGRNLLEFVLTLMMGILASIAGILFLWNSSVWGAEVRRLQVYEKKRFIRVILELSDIPQQWSAGFVSAGCMEVFLSNTTVDPLKSPLFPSIKSLRISLIPEARGLRVKFQPNFLYFKKKTFVLKKPPRLVVDILSKTQPPPEMVDEIYLRAKLLIQSKKFQEALLLLKGLGKYLESYPKPYSDYIVLLTWLKEEKKAISLFENLTSSFPMRPYLLKNVARAYTEIGNHPKALALYERVLMKNPKDLEAIEGKFLCLFKTGQYRDALMFTRKGLFSPPLLSRIQKLQEDAITSLTLEKRQDILETLLLLASEGKQWAEQDYLLCLILFGHYESAIRWAEAVKLYENEPSPYILSWLGWAYFKTGCIAKAEKIYRAALLKDPKFIRARIGLAYCAAQSGRAQKALNELENMLQEGQDDLEIRFARAYAFEKQGLFLKAIKEYEQILSSHPENSMAQKLRLLALADLGTPSLALELARKLFPHDSSLHASFKQRVGAEHIRWREIEKSKEILLPLAKAGHLHAKFDYIVALVQAKEMKKAIEQFQIIQKRGYPIPPYVYETTAGAYLYMENPYKALELYNTSLRLNPNSLNARLGKFYTLQELRQWDEAWSIINQLDLEIPHFVGLKELPQPNWIKMDVTLAKGWLFVHENRLAEADQYFSELYQKAPAHTEIRNGLAHVYLWRGWPRRALKYFTLIEALDKDSQSSRSGLVMALNRLAYKDDARRLAQELLKHNPRDKHLLRVVRSLEVEQMREFHTYVSSTKEDDNSEGVLITTELSQPLSLYTRMYINGLWIYGSSKRESEHLSRVGLGLRHIFNSTFEGYQGFSFNRNGGNHLG